MIGSGYLIPCQQGDGYFQANRNVIRSFRQTIRRRRTRPYAELFGAALSPDTSEDVVLPCLKRPRSLEAGKLAHDVAP